MLRLIAVGQLRHLGQLCRREIPKIRSERLYSGLTCLSKNRSLGGWCTGSILIRPLLIAGGPRYVNAFGSPHKFDNIQDRWRAKDCIPDDWELMYKSDMDKYLLISLIGLGFVTAVSLTTIIERLFFSDKEFAEPLNTGENETLIVFKGTASEMFIFFLFGAVMMAHVYRLIMQIALRIYRSNNKYIAVFKNPLQPWKDKQVHFKREEVSKKKQGKYISMEHAYFNFGAKKALIMECNFRTPYHLNEILGTGSLDDR